MIIEESLLGKRKAESDAFNNGYVPDIHRTISDRCKSAGLLGLDGKLATLNNVRAVSLLCEVHGQLSLSFFRSGNHEGW